MTKYFLASIYLFSSAIACYAQTDANYSCAQTKQAHYTKQQQINWPKNAGLDLYDVKYHKLELNMTNTSIYVEGKVSTKALVIGPQMNDFVFELHPSLSLDSVKVNGVPTPFATNGTFKECALANSIPNNSLFTAEIWYHGTPTATGTSAIGEGISTGQSPSWGNRVTWTLSEPYSAYEWWPCKQSLNDKIDSVDVWITVGDSLKAGSNGILQQIVPVSGNRLRYEWKHRYPIDYYLISAAVAKYIDYSFYAFPDGNVDSVLVQNYIYDNPQTLPFFQTQINLTKDFIELYSQLVGPYPFENEKYGHCMAPFGGGMEHQTMTSQGSFSFTLTSHELFHQWFGDKVTCASWKDIWVNEGFASYGEYLALENLQPNQARQHMDDFHNSALSAIDGSVYVDDTTSPNRIFSGRLTYDKGATLVHMLRFLVNNDANFFQALKNYLTTNAYHTATGEDVKLAIENISGLDLDNFFDDYYYGEGYPIFSLGWKKSSNGRVYLKLSQTTSMPSVTPLFRIPVEIRLLSSTGDTTVRVMSDAPEVFFDFAYDKTVNIAQIDPNQWILNTIGTITQDNTLEVNQNNIQTATIYPTLTTDFIYLKDFEIGDVVEVVNMQGQILLSSQITSKFQQLSLIELRNGSYVIRSSKRNFKVIKQ